MTFLELSTRYLFSFVLLLFFPLSAQEEPEIDIQLATPLVVEVDPGKIVTSSFLVTNHTSSKEELLAKITLPKEWQTIPFEQVRFSLGPGEQSVQLLTIKVPKDYPAGQYKVQYLVQGLNEPSLTRVQDFFIHVLPNEKIGAVLLPPPKNIEAGEEYNTYLRIVNNGNVSSEISIEATTSLKNKVSVDPNKFTLKPKEVRKVLIDVNTKPLQTHHSLVEVLWVKINPVNIQLSGQVEIFPKSNKRFDPYLYLPSTTTFGYGMKDEEVQAYAQIAGSGFIDEGKKRNLDYYALVPALNQFNVYRNLGGTPEKAYVHYWDENVDAYLGEGQYKLTPLTMRTRFGKGGALSVKPGLLKFGGLYVDNTSSVSRKNGAGFINYTPNKLVSLTTSYLFTDLTSNSDQILEKTQKSNTGSFRAIFTPTKKISFDTEYAATLDGAGSIAKRSSYYLRTVGEVKQGFSWGLEKILAKPQFVGYYNNTDIFSVSSGVPIYKRARGFYSCNMIKTNLNESLTRSLTDYRSHTGGVTNSFNNGLYSSLTYNYISFRDRDFSQKTQFGRLNLGQNFKMCSLQTSIELGEQESPNWTERTRSWQNYKLYCYVSPAPEIRFAMFGNFGNVILNEFANKRYTLGTSLNWRFTKRLFLNLLYEQTFYPQGISRKHFNSSLGYTFRNGQQFKFQSNFYSVESEKNKFEFLLSYTIPWKLPIGKKRSVSSLKGKINKNQDSKTRLVVNCDGQRILTDNGGAFTFNNLTPGAQSVFIEESDEFVYCEKLPINVNLRGGKREKIEVNTAPPGKISGTLEMFCFDEDSWEGGSNKREIIFHQGKQDVIVQAHSEDRKQIYQEITNKIGEFSFARLKPGKWIVTFVNPNPPEHHYLDHEKFEVELSSGEKQTINAKILPIVRRMRFIDSGEVN